jgi:hypothetical protein
MSTTLAPRAPRTTRRTPIYMHTAAWAIPALVLSEFALLAIVPVAMLVIGTLADRRVKPLGWWAGLVAAAYAAPLVVWLVRDDRAQSLSKDMSPVFAALIVAASIAFLIKIYTRASR